MCQVFRVTGVKLALEGVYRWIYFMASKQDPQRPVATRYFGVFEDGSLKVRGLMCRRRDTPPFVRRAQEAMLTKTGRGGDARGTGGPEAGVGGDGRGLPAAPPGGGD